ncbi:MAG: hypothetical protein A2Z90_14260 [Burkholderiales bacterium GWA2_64_37]|nr:MAG: hypothetical protein A2Z90_14260 [Burkholderiales bacterium GWA2_64_37]
MIEILSTGGMSTIQDLGRHGYRSVGLGVGGPLDALAARAGNAMLGNGPTCAFIEVVLFPFRVRFTEECRIAVTGADSRTSIEGRPVWPWWTLTVRAGQEMRLEGPCGGGVGYVCVGGGIDVPAVLGSRSTDLKAAFGGFEGRTLRKGDRLHCLPDSRRAGTARLGGFGVRPPLVGMPKGAAEEQPGATPVRVLPASEWDCFTPEARDSLVTTDWKISPHSNRIGARLEGPVLATERKLELLSHGIVPGVIQVPPSGQPIVMQCDAQTSGGYPKIATVIEADQWRVAQTPPGRSLRFQAVTLQEAQAAWREQCDYLHTIEQASRWAAGTS